MQMYVMFMNDSCTCRCSPRVMYHDHVQQWFSSNGEAKNLLTVRSLRLHVPAGFSVHVGIPKKQDLIPTNCQVLWRLPSEGVLQI